MDRRSEILIIYVSAEQRVTPTEFFLIFRIDLQTLHPYRGYE